MTIEFNCPFCKALIRVPDSARGGKGKCPQCSTRVTVPKTSTVKAIDPPIVVAPPPVVAAPPVAPKRPAEPVRDGRPQEIENFFDPDYDPRKAAQQDEVIVEPESSPDAFPGEFAEEPVAAVADTSAIPTVRKRVSLLKRIGRGLWIIPVLIAAVGGGWLGWYIWQQVQKEQLGGELTAEMADELELPPILVEKFSVKRDLEEVQPILTDLEKSPVPLKSSLMQVEFSGSKRGVFVRLEAGPTARFYRVDLSGNKQLLKYREKHAPDFEKQRVKLVEKQVTSFIADFEKVVAKKNDVSSLKDYRNSFALPALVRGMGFHVVATHAQTIYPCVYEDRDGALYFLLPPTVKEFDITGREDNGGAETLKARFKVKVTGMMKVEKKEGDAAGATKKKKTKPGPVFKRSDQPEDMDESMEDGEMKKGE